MSVEQLRIKELQSLENELSEVLDKHKDAIDKLNLRIKMGYTNCASKDYGQAHMIFNGRIVRGFETYEDHCRETNNK